MLSDDSSPVTDHALLGESLATDIDRALSRLNEREQEVVKLFFGVGCREMTLEEIGDKFGLTRERVRQIKEKALLHLRRNPASVILKQYLF